MGTGTTMIRITNMGAYLHPDEIWIFATYKQYENMKNLKEFKAEYYFWGEKNITLKPFKNKSH